MVAVWHGVTTLVSDHVIIHGHSLLQKCGQIKVKFSFAEEGLPEWALSLGVIDLEQDGDSSEIIVTEEGLLSDINTEDLEFSIENLVINLMLCWVVNSGLINFEVEFEVWIIGKWLSRVPSTEGTLSEVVDFVNVVNNSILFCSNISCLKSSKESEHVVVPVDLKRLWLFGFQISWRLVVGIRAVKESPIISMILIVPEWFVCLNSLNGLGETDKHE